MTTADPAVVAGLDAIPIRGELDQRVYDLRTTRRALPLTRRAEFDAYMLGALSCTATTRAWASALGIARRGVGLVGA
jgi:hypothetical protein